RRRDEHADVARWIRERVASAHHVAVSASDRPVRDDVAYLIATRSQKRGKIGERTIGPREQHHVPRRKLPRERGPARHARLEGHSDAVIGQTRRGGPPERRNARRRT